MSLGQYAVVTFAAGGERFALPLDAVSRVVHRPSLVQPPARIGFLEGFFNFRGACCASVSLAGLLQLPGPATAQGFYDPLLVLASDPPRLALKVDKLLQSLPSKQWHELPLADDRRYGGAAVCIVEPENGDAACLLNPQAILIREEEEKIHELGEFVRQRVEALA